MDPRKIFISYKYGDKDVRFLPSGGLLATTARHYVDKLETLLDANDHIYKGESDDESLAGFKDETIESKLRDKIFDSTITIVLISKTMKDPTLKEDEQWIPWEISYSLKEMCRGDRTSGTNAVLAVALPDKIGSYEYFMKSVCPSGCISFTMDPVFEIISKNMFNRKKPNLGVCGHHSNNSIHVGNNHSYIYPVKWDDFIGNINSHLKIASQINEALDDYDLIKLP